MFGAAVLASSTSSHDGDHDFDNDYTDGYDGSIEDAGTAKQHPLLPLKRFSGFLITGGRCKPRGVEQSADCEMSVNEVETYINRPDINPKDWANYEMCL